MDKDIENELIIDSQNLNAYSAGLLQGIAYRALNDHLTEVLEKFELTIPEWKLLGQLNDHGKMSLDNLSKRLGVEPPLTTRMIFKLQNRKLIEKVIDPKDRRGKIVSISNAGKDLIQQIELPVKIKMAHLLKGTSREELLNYLKVLATIVNNSNEINSVNTKLKGGEEK